MPELPRLWENFTIQTIKFLTSWFVYSGYKSSSWFLGEFWNTWLTILFYFPLLSELSCAFRNFSPTKQNPNRNSRRKTSKVISKILNYSVVVKLFIACYTEWVNKLQLTTPHSSSYNWTQCRLYYNWDRYLFFFIIQVLEFIQVSLDSCPISLPILC